MRYEKIKFKDFSSGELDQYEDEIGIQSSDRVILENKTLNSCYQLKNTVHQNYKDFFAILNPSDNLRYVLTVRSSDYHLCLYTAQAGIGSLTLYKDFGAGSSGLHLFYFNDLVIVIYVVGGVYYLSYSSTPSISGSWVTILFNLGYLEIIEYQDKIYALKNYGAYSGFSDLYVSEDGINYKLIKSNIPGTSFLIVGNTLLTYAHNRSTTLYKINSDYSFDVFLKGFSYYGTSILFNDFLFYFDEHIIDSYTPIQLSTLYTLSEDGTITKFKQFPYNILPKFIGKTSEKIFFYFYDNGQYHIYSINKNGAIIKEYKFSSHEFYLYYLLSDSTSTDLLGYDETGDPIFSIQVWSDKEKKRVIESGFETIIVDDGEIIPKQIIIKHDPLLVGTSVQVYFRKDKSTSWGSVVLTSNISASIKKVYNFPKNTKCDYIEFKVLMKTSDTSKYINNPELIFLYQRVGLPNSK